MNTVACFEVAKSDAEKNHNQIKNILSIWTENFGNFVVIYYVTLE